MQSAAASIISCKFFFLQKDALIVIQVIYYHVNPILSSNVESISSRGSCILQQPLSPAAEMKLEAVQWNWGHSGKSTTETLAVSMSYKFENSQNSILPLKCGWWGVLCLQLLKLGQLLLNELTVLNNTNCVLLEQEKKNLPVLYKFHCCESHLVCVTLTLI